MADSVYLEQKSVAVDDYREPMIHMITFTSEGELSMVKTSTSPVKVEILQHENGLEEHSSYPHIESTTSSNGTAVGKSTMVQLHHGNRVTPQDIGSQSDQDPNHSAGSKTEGVPRAVLKGREIVTVPEVYLAIQNIWKSHGSIQRLMPKLGIQVMRFSPQELTRMKQRGVIKLTVKCCSYILKSDFEIIAEKYDETHGTHHRESLLFLPPVDLDDLEPKQVTTTAEHSPTSPRANCHKSPTGFKMQTFLLSTGQTVTCTNELQGLFEAHFQNPEILNHCLFSLGISQGKFTDSELQESSARFVGGPDRPKLGLSRSYVMIDDAERVVSYAANLLNTGKPEINWAAQPKVLSGKDELDKEAKISHSPDKGETLSEDQDSHTNVSSFEQDKTVETMKSFRSKRSEGSSEGHPVSSARGQGCSSNSASRFTDGQGIVGAKRNLKASDVDGETSSSQSGHSELKHFASQSVSSSDPSVEPKMSDIQPSLSRNRTEPTKPEALIRTFVVDGEVIVCVPDVHRAVIQLHSQSVQVGSYMQRLRITPRRFSCVCLKQLKAYDVLSAKATVCTYITKSDAERLLFMYDQLSLYTESRLQEIHWAEPIALDDDLTIQEKCNEAIQEGKESPEDEGTPQSPTTIPTFEIDGGVFVSVPDAHRAIQALNGQSVLLRYYLDKLGIPKYKFSYSQVHQIKACSVLKRPSMCTFITKSDAERLVQFYVNHKNASRLALIQWLPAIKPGSESEVERSDADDAMQPCAQEHCTGSRNNDPLTCSGNTGKLQPPSSGYYQTVDAEAASQGGSDESSAVSPDVQVLHIIPHSRVEAAQVSELASSPCMHYCRSCCTPGNAQRSVDSFHAACTAHAGSAGVQMQCPSHFTTTPSFPIVSSSSSCPVLSPSASVRLGQTTARASTHQGGCIVGEKRALSETEEGSNGAHVKKLREDNEELMKTLQRKETELKLLHDAYQQQIENERARRKMVEQELEELKRRCQCFPVRVETRTDK